MVRAVICLNKEALMKRCHQRSQTPKTTSAQSPWKNHPFLSSLQSICFSKQVRSSLLWLPFEVFWGDYDLLLGQTQVIECPRTKTPTRTGNSPSSKHIIQNSLNYKRPVRHLETQSPCKGQHKMRHTKHITKNMEKKNIPAFLLVPIPGWARPKRKRSLVVSKAIRCLGGIYFRELLNGHEKIWLKMPPVPCKEARLYKN